MKQFFSHPIIIIIVTILAVAALLSLNKSKERVHIAKQNVAVLEHEVAKIAKEVAETQLAITAADTEFAKDRTLRNELLLQKTGEYIVQIPSPEEKPSSVIELEQRIIDGQIEEKVEKEPVMAWRQLLF